jgi:transposase-like protein
MGEITVNAPRTFLNHYELAILLYDSGVSLRRVKQVLGWIGVERSHVAIWKWIQKFGQRLGEADRRPSDSEKFWV